MARRFLVVALFVVGAAAPAPAQFTFTKIADTSTTIPGGSGAFVGFAAPSVSGTTVAFLGVGSGGQAGIYTGTGGGTVARVADLTTDIPGGVGDFSQCLPTAVSGTMVTFIGREGSDFGIYFKTGGGSLTKLIAEGDFLDGQEVADLTGFGEYGLDGTTLTFRAFFVGASAIYSVALVPVPVPGLVLGLAAAGLGLARGIRWRRADELRSP